MHFTCIVCTDLMYNTTHTVKYVQISPSHSPVRSRSRNGTRGCIRLKRDNKIQNVIIIIIIIIIILYIKYILYSMQVYMHTHYITECDSTDKLEEAPKWQIHVSDTVLYVIAISHQHWSYISISNSIFKIV